MGFGVCLVSLTLSAQSVSVETTPTPSAPLSKVPPAPDGSTREGRISSVSPRQDLLEIRADGQRLLLRVIPVELQQQLKGFSPGDLVRVKLSATAAGPVLQAIQVQEEETEIVPRLGMLVGSAALFFLLTTALLRGKPSRLVLGLDNRFSTSKAQTVLWFGIVLTTYVAVLWRRVSAAGMAFAGGINIPDNLLLLSGFSTFTLVAAKAITETKERRAAAATAQGAAAPPAKTVAPAPRFQDLFADDQGRIDVADFQILLITLLAAIVYLMQVFEFMRVIELHSKVTLPDADKTILAFFGLGQGAYLVKKVAGDSA